MKLQFRLSYLIYLLTLFAIAFAILRRFMWPDAGWMFLTSVAIPVFTVTFYFAVRFPILLSRLMKGRRVVAAKKVEMVQLADEARARALEKKLEAERSGIRAEPRGEGPGM